MAPVRNVNFTDLNDLLQKFNFEVVFYQLNILGFNHQEIINTVLFFGTSLAKCDTQTIADIRVVKFEEFRPIRVIFQVNKLKKLIWLLFRNHQLIFWFAFNDLSYEIRRKILELNSSILMMCVENELIDSKQIKDELSEVLPDFIDFFSHHLLNNILYDSPCGFLNRIICTLTEHVALQRRSRIFFKRHSSDSPQF